MLSNFVGKVNFVNMGYTDTPGIEVLAEEIPAR
jgi:hypothetical protein